MSISSETRIAINTVASYSRTLVQIIIILFTSRWVLKELGIVDYGIFNLIGSILIVLSFLNTVISNGNARFLSIAIGKGDLRNLCNLFKSILCIHLLFPPLLLMGGYIIGVYCIENILIIPPEKLCSSLFILKISIISGIISFASAPYLALFIAYQDIVISSLISLLQTILLFISAYVLRFIDGDKLIIYACFYSLTNICTNLFYIIIASYKYRCCRTIFYSKICVDKIVDILKYSFWNMFGDLGHLIRTQGISIVVNMSFGPTGNAALGFANQLATQACNLTNALSIATSPEVNRRYGMGNKISAYELSLFISKMGVFFMLIISIPIIFNIDSILYLWLKTVPPCTKELCISFIIMFIVEKYSLGETIYLRTLNKMAFSQTIMFISYSLSVVLPYCGFIYYFGLEGIGFSCIISMIFSRIGFIIGMKKNVRRYSFGKIFIRLILPTSLFLLLVVIFSVFIKNSSVNILFIIISSIILLLLTVFFYFTVVLSKNERILIYKTIKIGK